VSNIRENTLGKVINSCDNKSITVYISSFASRACYELWELNMVDLGYGTYSLSQ